VIKKKKRPSGVYSTILSTSLPLNTWPTTANYNVKNYSIGVDHAAGMGSYYSSWTWAIPGFHDRKILKKKQRRDIDNLLERWEKGNTIPWLNSNEFSPISVSSNLVSSGPLSPPTGIITYMDVLGTYTGGNNNNNP
jgi:hypothetical protein